MVTDVEFVAVSEALSGLVGTSVLDAALREVDGQYEYAGTNFLAPFRIVGDAEAVQHAIDMSTQHTLDMLADVLLVAGRAVFAKPVNVIRFDGGARHVQRIAAQCGVHKATIIVADGTDAGLCRLLLMMKLAKHFRRAH